MASQPTPPPPTYPPRNKGLIAGLIKGNQWLISPYNKSIYNGRQADTVLNQFVFILQDDSTWRPVQIEAGGREKRMVQRNGEKFILQVDWRYFVK